MNNPIGLTGIEFVEFSSREPEKLRKLFMEFGFSFIERHEKRAIEHFVQNEIHFLLNTEAGSSALIFQERHGPSICSMGWRVKDPAAAFRIACERGARAAIKSDYSRDGKEIPAIYGIGDSLIYFINDVAAQDSHSFYSSMGFQAAKDAKIVQEKGFISIDHLTNNVENGTMKKWGDFYKNIFGFTEVRYFDIRGVQTGLTSYALKSPCGTFCIPINEAKEEKSQINEYLREYNGPGIQHLAFLTNDILSSLDRLKGSSIETLDIDADYYKEVFERVKNVTEDKKKIQDLKVLVDGDDEGYLLQIFTKNIIGPIFIEIIQRKNHYSFGEGNFKALFRSIERDQAKRGIFGESA